MPTMTLFFKVEIAFPHLFCCCCCCCCCCCYCCCLILYFLSFCFCHNLNCDSAWFCDDTPTNDLYEDDRRGFSAYFAMIFHLTIVPRRTIALGSPPILRWYTPTNVWKQTMAGWFSALFCQIFWKPIKVFSIFFNDIFYFLQWHLLFVWSFFYLFGLSFMR